MRGAALLLLALAGCGDGGIETQDVHCPKGSGAANVSVEYPGKTAAEIEEHVIAFAAGIVPRIGESAESLPSLYAADGSATISCISYPGDTITFVWRSP